MAERRKPAGLLGMLMPDSPPGLLSFPSPHKPLVDGLLGYRVRDQLYPGEDTFFKQNANTAGMAAETGDIVLNPYSPAGVDHNAVARNEAMRLHLRDKGLTPSYGLTPQQQEFFQGTPYEGNPGAQRESIAGRVYSGDPSANATEEQEMWLARLLAGMSK